MKTLQIGDDKTAILILQRSQTDPQKALAELVENGIDANAKNIVIERRKKQGEIELVIIDDGDGVKAGNNGLPDFDRVAGSICDSFKKYLDELSRSTVQGEFGIGLLGFAAIGERLRMLSRSKSSDKTVYFELISGTIEYETGVAVDSLYSAGSKIVIGPVHKEAQTRLTAEKLSAYLGQELRERIRQSGVSIRVNDQLPGGKEIVVKPVDYKGLRIGGIDKVKTNSGNIEFKLFVAQEGDEGQVSVYRRGTRVLDSVTLIPELDHFPWNDPMLEGMIDSRFVNISPASRRGIIPDENLTALVEAAKSLEPSLLLTLKQAKAEREDKSNREIIRSLNDLFAEVMRDLSADYAWFDAKKGGNIVGPRPSEPREPSRVAIAAGPLDRATVTPKSTTILPREKKQFTAKGWTPDNKLIPTGIRYTWKLSPPLGSIEIDDNVATFQADLEEGETTLTVTLNKDGKQVSAVADIQVTKKSKKTQGLSMPSITPIDRPGEPWRSKWLLETRTLQYNTGHPNYKSAKQRGNKAHFRYIAFLIAKHLVIHNFAKSGEETVLERMIEVVSSLESKAKR